MIEKKDKEIEYKTKLIEEKDKKIKDNNLIIEEKKAIIINLQQLMEPEKYKKYQLEVFDWKTELETINKTFGLGVWWNNSGSMARQLNVDIYSNLAKSILEIEQKETIYNLTYYACTPQTMDRGQAVCIKFYLLTNINLYTSAGYDGLGSGLSGSILLPIHDCGHQYNGNLITLGSLLRYEKANKSPYTLSIETTYCVNNILKSSKGNKSKYLLDKHSDFRKMEYKNDTSGVDEYIREKEALIDSFL